MGRGGRVRGSKDDDTEVGQEMQIQYDVFGQFDYGDAPPFSPYPISPPKALAPLQHNLEDDVFDGGNAPLGAVYRGQG